MGLLPLPTVENLRLGAFVEYLYQDLKWKDDVENGQWLELLRPFTAVKSLYLSEEIQPDISSALQELVGGGTTEVLPSLQISSWQGSSHPDLFRKPLDSSLPPDSFPVIL